MLQNLWIIPSVDDDPQVRCCCCKVGVMFRGLGRLIVFTVAAVGFRVSVPIQMQALWALV